jgi:hypothetical protein
MKPSQHTNRRLFLQSTATITAGIAGLNLFPGKASAIGSAMQPSWGIVGPTEGFSLHIGTLLSMMRMMRHMILQPVKGLDVEQLDHIHDANSNSIGSMLLHIAATEKYYQLNTFENVKWGAWTDEVKKEWDIPMKLGEDARKHIKGHNLDYYLNILEETREKTITEFKKRDDDWLMTLDKEWGWNNYAKWFHVCEHESNHNGQIKWIKSRLPGAKPGSD